MGAQFEATQRTLPIAGGGQVHQRENGKVLVHRGHEGVGRVDQQGRTTLGANDIGKARREEEVGQESDDGGLACL